MARLRATVHSDVASLRRARGLTQRELGRIAGVSRQTIVEIEAGGYNPSAALALRLGVALQAPVERLFSLPAEDLAEVRARAAQAPTGAGT
jgi:putative transcriptional regulator